MRVLSAAILSFSLMLLFGVVHAEDVMEDIAKPQVEKSASSIGPPLNGVRQGWGESLQTG